MVSISQILIVGFLVLLLSLVFFSYSNSNAMPGRGLQLFRVLFPSWKFFDDVAAIPTLHYRLETSPDLFTQWEEIPKKPQRRLLGIFVNPELNCYLACQSLLQQLESDIGDLQSEGQAEQFFQSVSYQLTLNLVRDSIKELTTDRRFQFKICRAQTFDRLAQTVDVETFLVSQLHEA